MSRSALASLADMGSDTTAAIWLNIYRHLSDRDIGQSMLVCKTFHSLLPVLIKSIWCTSPTLDQHLFDRITKTFQNVHQMDLSTEYDEDLPELDWSQVRLPHLIELSLAYYPLKSIDFNTTNTPRLESLSIENSRGAELKLDLPNLTHLNLEYTEVTSAVAGSSELHSPSVWPEIFILLLLNIPLVWHGLAALSRPHA